MAERGHAWVRDITSLNPRIASSTPALLALSILANVIFQEKSIQSLVLRNKILL